MFKKLLSIFFLGAYFFGSIFYPLYLLYSIEKEAETGAKELYLSSMVSGHNEQLTFKIPFGLPYAADWNSPQEAVGLLEYKGKFYSMIKKDFRADTLFLFCIENTNASKIHGELVKHIQDSISHDSPSKNPFTSFLKLFKKDFFYQSTSFVALHLQIIRTTAPTFVWRSCYSTPLLGQESPPPKYSFT